MATPSRAHILRAPPHRPIPLAISLALVCSGLILADCACAQTASPEAAPAPSSSASAPAKTSKPAPRAEQLDRVQISGGPSDEAQRRAATASKIVIGREEIERFGDSSLGEVLKRLPGVTTGGRPGRGGDIRMRGMGSGYTQLLVNGERMPPGFSLDQLPPDQVERIEVLRAPTAEYGARAVAGTINIVLREALQKRINDLRIGVATERDQLRPEVSWTRNDKLDDQGGAYNLNVSANQNRRRDDVNSSTVTRDLPTQTESTLSTLGESDASSSGVHLAGRLQWRFGADSLSIQPFVVGNKSTSSSHFTQTPGLNYDQVQTDGSSRFTMARLNSQWQTRIGEDTRLELRGGGGRGNNSSHSFRQEFKAQGQALATARTQDDTVDGSETSWSLNGKLSRQLQNEHSLVSGVEAESSRRDQTRISLQNGLSRPELNDFGDDLKASSQRTAIYAQDEWNPSKQWSAYAGLRWEGIETKSSALNYAVNNRSSVWTPLFHAVWKPSEASRDQVRMSLTRSYRSPQLQDLIARPSINSQYPSGANVVNYPDRAGNPNLKPELATGIDLAFESYLSKGGILSANVFVRRINDLMRNVTTLETVSWSDQQRWVSRPTNIGRASTQGLELEAKFRLDEFFAQAWPVSVRSNLSLFHSSVEGIPGPNNRLDQQPKGTANLGADYRLRSLPMSLGASINYTPATQIQQTVLQANTTSHKLVTDAFVLWNIDLNTMVRLSATNLTAQDYSNGSVIATSDQLITSSSIGRTFTLWQLKLELKI